MKAIWALASKDLLILFRDKAGLFWVFAFPLVYALFFGTIFSGSGEGSGGLKLALVDRDGSPAAAAFITRLEESPALEVERLPLPEARAKVRRGERVAYLVVPEGFGRQDLLFGGGPAPALEVGIDPSRRAESGYLKGLLIKAWFGGLRELFRDPAKMQARIGEWRRRLEADPELSFFQKAAFRGFFGALDHFMGQLRTEHFAGGEGRGGFQGPRIVERKVERRWEGPRSAFEVTFPSAVLWGILGCAAGFAVSLVRERVHGTMLRLRLAPIGSLHIVAGKGLSCFLAALSVALFLLLFGRLALGLRLGDPLLLAVGVAATAFCFAGIMMLLSVMGRTEQAVGGVGWAVMMVAAMLGGGMVPLFFMPGWMRAASNLSPVKWGILSLEGAIWRDFTWAETVLPLGILVGLGTTGLVVGGWVLSRRLE